MFVLLTLGLAGLALSAQNRAVGEAQARALPPARRGEGEEEGEEPEAVADHGASSWMASVGSREQEIVAVRRPDPSSPAFGGR